MKVITTANERGGASVTNYTIRNYQSQQVSVNCNKAHRVINIANQIEIVENEMMNIAIKANRSENRRNERAMKRQLR